MSFSFDSLAGVPVKVFGHNKEHLVDGKNIVEGGHAHAVAAESHQDVLGKPPLFSIYWQNGPVNRETGEGVNGAMVEDVLSVAIRRMESYQYSDFAHPKNKEAIMHINRALEALEDRRLERRERGVEGTQKP